jgi:type IV pilus assembly protein PilW
MNRFNPRRTIRHNKQLGLTLVELMVSMALGLFIVVALLLMLANVSRSNTELVTGNRAIESGRFSVQLLQTSVSHAGYWGGHVPKFDDLTAIAAEAGTDIPTAVINPCMPYSAANWTTAYVQSMVGVAAQPDIDPVAPATRFCSQNTPTDTAVVANQQANTDVLIVRGLEPCLIGTGTDDCSDTRTAVNPHLYAQTSRCSADPGPYVFSNAPTLFTLLAGDCVTAAPIRRFTSSIYYVRNFAVTVGDGIPTLVRAQFGLSAGVPGFTPAQALVEGVEGFRVQYGIDNLSDTGATVGVAQLAQAITWPTGATTLNTPTNRGNGLPDSYVSCSQVSPCNLDQLVNVTAVKVFLLVRGERVTPGYTDTKKYCLQSTCTSDSERMGPFNDGFKRYLFNQTIRLTNVSSRRETS